MTFAALDRLWRDRPKDPRFERAALVSLVVAFLFARGHVAADLAEVAPSWVLLGAGAALAVATPLLRLHRRPLVWILIAAAMLARLATRWWITDDHLFLLAYWMLALGLALLQDEPRDALATSARSLLGLVFLFATLWKVLSPPYVDGSFFHYELLADPRFHRATLLLRSLSADALAANAASLVALRDQALAGATFHDAPRVGLLAFALTWATVLIEGALAVAFLLPARVPQTVRDALLLVFLAGTYVLAPVLLFGVLLAAMGLAQAGPRAPIAYLLAVLYVIGGAMFWIGG